MARNGYAYADNQHASGVVSSGVVSLGKFRRVSAAISPFVTAHGSHGEAVHVCASVLRGIKFHRERRHFLFAPAPQDLHRAKRPQETPRFARCEASADSAWPVLSWRIAENLGDYSAEQNYARARCDSLALIGYSGSDIRPRTGTGFTSLLVLLWTN